MPGKRLTLPALFLKLRLRRILIIAIGLGLVGYSTYGTLQRYQATHGAHPLPAGNSVTTTSPSRPDETPINPKSTYKVAANQPRSIHISSIGSTGFIQKVGLDKHNAIATPGNIHLAGWYSPGTEPGGNGVSIIAGHVQGRYQPGIFKQLAKVSVGDEFWIEFGDGSRRTFKVVRTQSYPAQEVVSEMFKQVSGVSQQLNLITCDGAYNAASGQYNNRLLVVAARTS